MGEAPRVSAVVLAYGSQPLLGRVVDSLLTSTGVDVDVVLVDNGGTGGDPAVLEELGADLRGQARDARPQHGLRGGLEPGGRGRGRRVRRLRQRRRAGPSRCAGRARRHPGPTGRPGRRPRDRVGPAARPARPDQLRRQPGPLPRAELGRRSQPTGIGLRRHPSGGLRLRGDDGDPPRRVPRGRWLLRDPVHLCRGHRSEPARVAARLVGDLRAGRGRPSRLRVRPQPRQVLPARTQPAVRGADGLPGPVAGPRRSGAARLRSGGARRLRATTGGPGEGQGLVVAAPAPPHGPAAPPRGRFHPGPRRPGVRGTVDQHVRPRPRGRRACRNPCSGCSTSTGAECAGCSDAHRASQSPSRCRPRCRCLRAGRSG